MVSTESFQCDTVTFDPLPLALLGADTFVNVTFFTNPTGGVNTSEH